MSRFGSNYRADTSGTACSLYEVRAAENARVKITKYCKEEKTNRTAFGKMIGLTDSGQAAIARFMKGECGVRGAAYPNIERFFSVYDIQQARKGIEKAKNDLKESKEKKKIEEKEKQAVIKKEEKEKKALIKTEEKEKKALIKTEEKEKKAASNKEEKENKIPVNKEKKVSTKRMRDEGANPNPNPNPNISPPLSIIDSDDHAIKEAKIEASSSTVEGPLD
jgi:flagellar biosynthesis GTPase FlhF